MNSHLNRIHDWAALAREARYHASDLARLCRICPRQLQRYFHEELEQSPQQWLDDLRLRKAAELLLNGAHVKEVAYELHFTDPSHFIRRFKRKYGHTPLQFAMGGVRSLFVRTFEIRRWRPCELGVESRGSIMDRTTGHKRGSWGGSGF
ncbi:MAG TPA: helix-turn-helix transcriptional regulator [Methylomirabilota bacterium]|nr:helix-turn-helix transcriptional regulator [Methylomirabilota bacterium]